MVQKKVLPWEQEDKVEAWGALLTDLMTMAEWGRFAYEAFISGAQHAWRALGVRSQDDMENVLYAHLLGQKLLGLPQLADIPEGNTLVIEWADLTKDVRDGLRTMPKAETAWGLNWVCSDMGLELERVYPIFVYDASPEPEPEPA